MKHLLPLLDPRTVPSPCFVLDEARLAANAAILDSVQQSFTVRIIEIQEVFKEAKHSVTLVFGEKVPTLYNKARR